MTFQRLISIFLFSVVLLFSHANKLRASTQTECIEAWNARIQLDLEENGIFVKDVSRSNLFRPSRPSRKSTNVHKYLKAPKPPKAPNVLMLKRLSISIDEPWSLELSKDRWQVENDLPFIKIECRSFGIRLLSELDRIRERRFDFLRDRLNYSGLVSEIQNYLTPVYGTEKERTALIEVEPYAHAYFSQLDSEVRKLLKDQRLASAQVARLANTESKIVILTKHWTRLPLSHQPLAESHADTKEVGLRPWDVSPEVQKILYVHELAHLDDRARSTTSTIHDVEAFAWLRTFEFVAFLRSLGRLIPPLVATIEVSANAQCDANTLICNETSIFKAWIKFVVDSNYFE